MPSSMFRRLVVVLAVACLPPADSRSGEPPQPAKPPADPMIGTEAGQVRDDNGLKMQLVWCPPGVVVMGDVEESPIRAFLTHGYWIGSYEVTQEEWKLMMAAEPWRRERRHPIGDEIAGNYVSWNDATDFCAKLTEQERTVARIPANWEFTLPTEAQWEHACRAKTTTVFHFGDDPALLAAYAWYSPIDADDPAIRVRGVGQQLRVGQKKANPWGLYDMHGNVWEWCRDYYVEKLPGGRDPETTAGNLHRVVRGGSWRNSPFECRSARRDKHRPDHTDSTLGFRVALDPVRPAK